MTDNGRLLIKDFSFCFPGHNQPFLKNIYLEINPGEFAVVVGPSSCGKSTLALSITGLYPHVLGGKTMGSIQVSGLESTTTDVAELATKVGIVFQDPDSQFCNLFIEEEVAFGPENLLVERDEILERVKRYLKFVNLEGFDLRRVAELSGGQKQRVAIASILAMEPDIIILDQPTANLDPSGKEDIFETLYKLNQETGKTLILIEHQVDELIRYVDHLVVMENGGIRAQGTPRDIIKEHGKWMEQECGLWLPEVSRVGLAMLNTGVPVKKFPITVQELVPELQAVLPEISNECASTKQEPETIKTKDNIITAENVRFDYPSKKNILNGVSFGIKRGSIVALMGQNGSGKTTLSLMLIGLLKSSSGKINIDGLDMSKASLKEVCAKVGYVFQYPDHQFITDTVWDEVAYGLRNSNLEPKEIKKIVEETLAAVELVGLDKRHPFTLSMGEKRRLSIATMLVQKPEILILDEPSAGLDMKNCEHMMKIVSKLNQNGVTIIMITHTTYLVARYAQHVLVMDQGELVYDGDAIGLFQNLERIRTKAIEKPEILKAFEFMKEAGAKNVPSFLISDDVMRALNGGCVNA